MALACPTCGSAPIAHVIKRRDSVQRGTPHTVASRDRSTNVLCTLHSSGRWTSLLTIRHQNRHKKNIRVVSYKHMIAKMEVPFRLGEALISYYMNCHATKLDTSMRTANQPVSRSAKYSYPFTKARQFQYGTAEQIRIAAQNCTKARGSRHQFRWCRYTLCSCGLCCHLPVRRRAHSVPERPSPRCDAAHKCSNFLKIEKNMEG
jgi:hypothetical protein